MAILTKIDSNATGLRSAQEASYKVLRPTATGAGGVNTYAPVSWDPLEPNSYTDFGGQIVTVARNPINPSYQRKKGVTTDLDASGGFDSDLTQINLQDVLQGFFFASLRRKPETDKRGILNSEALIPIESITGTDTYNLHNLGATNAVIAGGGTGHAVGDLITLDDTGGTVAVDAVLEVTSVAAGVIDGVIIVNPGRCETAPTNDVAQGSTTGSGTGATFTMTYAAIITFLDETLINVVGLGDAANNGLHHVTAVTTTTLVVAETLVNDASPTATATITTVGIRGVTGDIDVDASGSLPALDTAGAINWTTFDLTPGEWIHIGGDVAGSLFAGSTNNGFARIRSITATRLTLDKTVGTMVTEGGGSLNIRVFFGRVLKNELGTSIVRRTYQLERTLGAPDTASSGVDQSEYLVGAVPGEMAYNIGTADKMTVNLGFVAASHEQRDVATGVKSGDRPSIVEADAFNTSSDFSRIKMAQVVTGDANPSALFAYVTDLTLSINPNLTPNKAVGVLGAFEVTRGTWAVGGELTAYFSEVSAIEAVQGNADVTIDFHLYKSNAGISFDLPLIALGDGRANIEQDQAITLPLSMEAATGAKVDSNLDYTFLMVFWDYLPALADTSIT